MPLDKDMSEILAVLSPEGAPDLSETGVDEARRAMGATSGLTADPEPVGSVENRTIPGPGGTLPVRIYRPEDIAGPLPILLFFHGGGWVLCSLDTHDGTARRLCNQAGALVISVDYRLAPEHRFPAAAEDCLAATCWASANAETLGGDPHRVAVSGDSAGGNLAAAVALMARDRGGPELVHQLLIYPALDARCDAPSMEANAEGYFLTAAAMRWFWGHYLGDDVTRGADPYASPLRADSLADLPPATILTAEFDPLRDEGEAYGKRLAQAAVDCETRRFEGVIHGFFGMQDLLPKAREAVALAGDRLRGAFGTYGQAPTG